MAGQRTSVYLTEDIAEAVKASGVPLAELVRRGLGGQPKASVPQRRPDADCPHPKGRRLKNGTYCPACGTGGLTGG